MGKVETVLSQNVFLHKIIDSLTHPFFVVDVADHMVTLANSAAKGSRQLSGSVTCYALSHDRTEPCQAGEHPCPLEQVKATGQPVKMEHVHTIDGIKRNIEIHGYPVVGDDGRVAQMIEYGIDITDRREAEAALRRRNRELTLLNWVIAAGISDQGPEPVMETACRELAQALDLPQAAGVLVNDERTAAVVVADHLSGKQRSPLRGQSFPVQGTPYLELLVSKQPLVAEDAVRDPRLGATLRGLLRARGVSSLLMIPLVVERELTGVLGLGSEVRRVFAAEELGLAMSVARQVAGTVARTRLSQTRRRLQAAIEQSSDSVVITDLDGTIQYINPAFEAISGYGPAEAVGAKPSILKSGQHPSECYKELWDCISGGKVWRGRLVNRRKSGALFTEDAVISPIRDAEGSIVSYVAVKRDVTREIQLEEQFRRAQKMESIGRLAGGVAHDFNNLLAVIMGHAELVLGSLVPQHPLHRDVTLIRETAEKAAQLTRQLLAFARRQVFQPQSLSLNELVRDLERMLRRLLDEDIELVTKLDPELGATVADPSQVEQVILNLVINARDAMPDGGHLTIETRNLSVEQAGSGPCPEAAVGEYVCLVVSDTGVGISEEARAHLFEPFFTTKGPGKGTGLGLATCYGIVHQSGGCLCVDSQEGAGAVFNVVLPLVGETEEAERATESQAGLPQGTEMVLIVEDEVALREVLCRAVRRHGYEVIEAFNGKHALGILSRRRWDIDVVVTDMVMPEMGGAALVKLLQERNPEVKLIVMSGHSSNKARLDGLDRRGIRFLEKPFSPARLVRALRELLDA